MAPKMFLASGSSPRGRGKPRRVPRQRRERGLIPAWAGKTRALPGCARGGGLIPAWAGKTTAAARLPPSRRAHPRVGGENTCPPPHPQHTAGSSPRGRGKLRDKAQPEQPNGLIPAGAGKTSFGVAAVSVMPAHPRGGGENRAKQVDVHGGFGSSPRGRGKPEILGVCDDGYRLIPAGAGKTKGRLPYAAVRQAHPRGGGENQDENIINLSKQGSSPRGRGKQAATDLPVVANGLIPAGAGKTMEEGIWVAADRAHPRGGGENGPCLGGGFIECGSSPRGRGKLGVEGGDRFAGRLIPAGAGKTLRSKMRSPWRPAHPRGGGENWSVAACSSFRAGSSPRGRGKRPATR